MSSVVNNMILSQERKKIEPNEIESKVLELLKDKKLTFYELVAMLDLKNGDRDILLDILLRLNAEGKIKKEKVQINLENGINLTTRFFI